MRINGLLTAMRTSMSGLSNQVKRMDAISDNIANAEKSPDASGKVYRRKIVVADKTPGARSGRFRNMLDISMRRTRPDHMDAKDISGPLGFDENDVNPVKVVEQNGFKMVFDPSHPRADENGYVKMPNVNPVEEMVDLVSTSRTYQANVTVMNAAKQMAKRALEI